MEQDFLKKVVMLYRQLRREMGDTLQQDDVRRVKQLLTQAVSLGHIQSDDFGLNPILMSLETARLAVSEIGVRRDSVIAIMLMPVAPYLSEDERGAFGESVARILHGLEQIRQLYSKNGVVETENFRNLLLSLAEDVRVILIMIADRLNLMRQIRDSEQDALRRKVSEESMSLYAPLAHKLDSIA